MKKHNLMLLLFILLAVAPAASHAQCAMCGAALESSLNDPNSVAKGINKGILYIMAVPYVLIAFIFRKQLTLLLKTYRLKIISKKRRKQISTTTI